MRTIGTGCLAWLIVASVLMGGARGATEDQLRSSSPNVPEEWLTKAERTEFRETSRYDETVAFCQRLAAASDWIDYGTFGVSPEGRSLPLLIASKDRAFTPEAARAAGGMIVLVQNCIHAGECAGKDASLMLLRDLAVTKTRSELLDHITLLVVPIFNVDGHERFSAYSRINQNGPAEMGWRVTSRNLNLNRDYVKADTMEMRAWLALWNAWQPHLHIDNHTTDGGDWQYDILLAADTHATAAPPIAAWLAGMLLPHLHTALEADGHAPTLYFNLVDSREPAKGIRSDGFTPRFSTGYVSLRNRPSLLVEMHALKPYRTRVIGNYNVMRHTLALLNSNPDSLFSAIREAEAETVAMGTVYDPDVKLPVSVRMTERSVPITFKGYASRRELSEISGTVRVIYDNRKQVEFETAWYRETEPDKVVTPPLAYVIPPQWTEAIELVRLHHLRAERLVEPETADVESYRFSEISFAGRSYEGRTTPRFEPEPITERRTFGVGSVIVPLNQADAKVAVHLFEPDAPDSLVRWGFFNAVFEQKEYAESYVLEDLARKMLEASPELRGEFELKIRTDREFASSARARLRFFHERSPYRDSALNVYPIARLTKPLSARTTSLR